MRLSPAVDEIEFLNIYICLASYRNVLEYVSWFIGRVYVLFHRGNLIESHKYNKLSFNNMQELESKL